jgi:hypothetical protein
MLGIKKTVFIFLSALSCFVLVFISSCKKEQSPAKTNSQTNQTSFIVDDTTVANPTHSSFNSSGNFGIVVYGSGGNPELQIVFWGSQPPGSGTYIITSGQPSYGKCTFSFSNTHGTSTAISGSVNVTEGASSNNVATFSNTSVGGSAGNHIIRGTITY